MKALKTLCALHAASGDEGAVREYILSQLGTLPYTVDNLGNIIVEKKGEKTPKHKLMLAAHMDEVGFIITAINKDGFLSFAPVGGIDPKAALGKRVRVNGHLGVIGTAPVHLTAEEDAMPEISDMFIDIGAQDEAQAGELVSQGDIAVFESEYVEFGEGSVKSKAIDDRFGCALLLALLHEPAAYDFTACFTVREEIGLKGAGCAAHSVKPDIALVLESTTANDVCGVSGAERVCALSKGPVLSFMDRVTVYDRELYQRAMALAAREEIPAQTKTKIAGGNDAAAIQTAGDGVRVLALSLPTRYIHSSAGVAKKEDMEQACILAQKLIKEFGELEG